MQADGAMRSQFAVEQNQLEQELYSFKLTAEGEAKKAGFQNIRDTIDRQESIGGIAPWQAKLAHMQNDGREQNVEYLSMRDPNADPAVRFKTNTYTDPLTGIVYSVRNDGSYRVLHEPSNGLAPGQTNEQWFADHYVVQKNDDGTIRREGLRNNKGGVEWFDEKEPQFQVPTTPEGRDKYIQDRIGHNAAGDPFSIEDDGGFKAMAKEKEKEDPAAPFSTLKELRELRDEAIESLESARAYIDSLPDPQDREDGKIIINEETIANRMQERRSFYVGRLSGKNANDADPQKEAATKTNPVSPISRFAIPLPAEGYYRFDPPQTPQDRLIFLDTIENLLSKPRHSDADLHNLQAMRDAIANFGQQWAIDPNDQQAVDALTP